MIRIMQAVDFKAVQTFGEGQQINTVNPRGLTNNWKVSITSPQFNQPLTLSLSFPVHDRSPGRAVLRDFEQERIFLRSDFGQCKTALQAHIHFWRLAHPRPYFSFNRSSSMLGYTSTLKRVIRKLSLFRIKSRDYKT